MGILSLLQRSSFRRFRDGRPGPWGAIAVGAFGLRTVRRWSKRSEDVVYREVLKPGETVTVSHRVDSRRDLERSEKREKKQNKKAHKRTRNKA